MNRIKERYGPWALITGASRGIGEEFANQLAAHGINLFLVARDKAKLDESANKLQRQNHIEVKTLQADLTTEYFMDDIIRATKDYDIGLLVNNAGKEDSDHFLKITPEKHLQTLHLNTRAPLLLQHYFGNKMKERKRSGIINMSSIVAFQGVPYIANYAATKAYDLILSEGLAVEFRTHGIDVLAITPGFTNTNLAANYDFTGMPLKPLPAKKVVKSALKKLGYSRMTIPGGINKLLYYNGKFLFSRKMNTGAFGKVFKHILKNTLE